MNGNRAETKYFLSRMGTPSVALPSAGAPSRLSYLQQMLLSRRSKSASPSSLVQLATKKGATQRGGRGGRLLKSGLSPVTVKLAGVGGGDDKKEVEKTQLVNGVNPQVTLNPCDKEVVLTALKQKRSA